MFKGTLAGKDHGHLRHSLVDRGDDFVIAQGSAGLGNGQDPLRNGRVHAVAEGEKPVRHQSGAAQAPLGFIGPRFNIRKLAGQGRNFQPLVLKLV